MTCLDETMVDDMIRALMQIVNYCLWFKGEPLGKGHDQTSLKQKVTTHTSDPKLLAKTMRQYPWAKDLNTRNYVVEGSKLFRSTKRKLDLPPRFEHDSHHLDKVNLHPPP